MQARRRSNCRASTRWAATADRGGRAWSSDPHHGPGRRRQSPFPHCPAYVRSGARDPQRPWRPRADRGPTRESREFLELGFSYWQSTKITWRRVSPPMGAKENRQKTLPRRWSLLCASTMHQVPLLNSTLLIKFWFRSQSPPDHRFSPWHDRQHTSRPMPGPSSSSALPSRSNRTPYACTDRTIPAGPSPPDLLICRKARWFARV